MFSHGLPGTVHVERLPDHQQVGLPFADQAFDAVADLCEMAARKDPELQRLTKGGSVKIAACFPRAVKWLFSGASAPLNRDQTEVLNMREQSPEEILKRLQASDLNPNLPEDNKPPQASEQPGQNQ